jgi:long-chain acyl-CoA synthetase
LSMLIHEVASQGARFFPEKTALKCHGFEISYRSLEELSNRLAEQIRWHGLLGAHGGIFADNSIEYAVAYFAIAKAHGVIIPTPTSVPAERLELELEFCEVDYVITVPKYADLLRDLSRTATRIKALVVLSECGQRVGFESLLKSAPGGRRPPRPPRVRWSDEPAIMLRTSGTASHPKRVVLSHRNLMANVSSFLTIADLLESDKGLIVLPMTSSGTNTTELLAYLSAGMTVVLYHHPAFVLSELCRLIEAEKASVINVTPFILSLMLDKSHEVVRRVATLRKLFFASSPMPVEQLKLLTRTFPHTRLYYGYGLTEAAPRCTTLLPEFSERKIGSSGTPLKNVSLRIVDEERRVVPAGAVGEVAIQGPNVMLGYFKQPAATAAVLDRGWLYTGDCGLLDEEGFLFIKGRKKNTIITRGISVCAEEVEQEILENPGVRDACVAGVRNERVGESIVAYVVLHQGARPSEAQLKSFLRRRLEPLKVPSRIVFVSELQRNSNHKLVRGQSLSPIGESGLPVIEGLPKTS